MRLEEDEVERKKREELISKIREMERKPVDRTSKYDPSQTSEEISLSRNI